MRGVELPQTVQQHCERTGSQHAKRTDINGHQVSLPLEGSAPGLLSILLRHRAYRRDGDNREDTSVRG